MNNAEACTAQFRKVPPGPMLEQFGGIRSYLSVLQPHVLRGEPQDLICIQTITQSIAGLAPALHLSETEKRARTMLIFARSMIAHDGIATVEERDVLGRAFDRLIAAAADEGVF